MSSTDGMKSSDSLTHITVPAKSGDNTGSHSIVELPFVLVTVTAVGLSSCTLEPLTASTPDTFPDLSTIDTWKFKVRARVVLAFSACIYTNVLSEVVNVPFNVSPEYTLIK